MKSVYNCTGHELKVPNIVDSQGVYLFDEMGKRYLDLESGVWCTALGHKNQRINESIKRQLDSIAHTGYCYSNSVVEAAAKSILSITNFKGGKSLFLSSGSEAIEILRQIAKHITGNRKTLTLHDAYLGSYSSVLIRGNDWYSFNWERCQACPDNNVCSMSCEALKGIPEDISEFVFEPGSASGFVRFPPKPLIQNMVKIVRGNNGKIIANEVTTGIGRTGKWFGYQHYGIEPDMVAIGKGVGNGYPVSAAVLNQSVIADLKDRPFKYMQSHQNDPLGAAVAREVIETIEDEELIASSQKKGELFFSQLNALVDSEIVMRVRGRGLMFAVELANERVGNEIYGELIKRGYILCDRGSLFRIDPPLIISEEEFGAFTNAFSDTIDSMKNDT